MLKIEFNGRGWWRGSRPLNYEPTVIDDDEYLLMIRKTRNRFLHYFLSSLHWGFEQLTLSNSIKTKFNYEPTVIMRLNYEPTVIDDDEYLLTIRKTRNRFLHYFLSSLHWGFEQLTLSNSIKTK